MYRSNSMLIHLQMYVISAHCTTICKYQEKANMIMKNTKTDLIITWFMACRHCFRMSIVHVEGLSTWCNVAFQLIQFQILHQFALQGGWTIIGQTYPLRSWAEWKSSIRLRWLYTSSVLRSYSRVWSDIKFHNYHTILQLTFLYDGHVTGHISR